MHHITHALTTAHMTKDDLRDILAELARVAHTMGLDDVIGHLDAAQDAIPFENTICPRCKGSGEGMLGFSKCVACGGSGQT